MDTGRFLEDSLFGDDTFKKVLEDAGAGDLSTQPMAGAFTASDGGFSFQAASKASGKPVNPGASPRTSRFASMVPADTAMFVSTAGLSQAWDQAMTGENRKKIEQQLEDAGSPETLEEILDAAADELGVSSLDEVIHLLTGEAAVAIWANGDVLDDPDFAMLFEVTDEAKARSVLETVSTKDASGPAKKETVNGIEMITVDDGAYAIFKGTAVVGTPAGVRTVLEGPKDRLDGAHAYKHAASALGVPLGSFAFINLQPILQDSDISLFAESDGALDALEALIFNVVNSDGLARFSGALTVED